MERQQQLRATASLAAVFSVRLLGLFMIYPVFAAYAANLSGANPYLIGEALGIYGLTQGLLQIPFGLLSDRVGRRPLLIGFGALGTIFTVPLLTAISRARGPWEALALIAAAWLIVSGYTAINAVVKAELFPAAIRATGVGLPYAIAVSLFGGSAEYVAFWFKSIGHESVFYWYATLVIACTLLVAVFMRDTKKVSAIDQDLLTGARA